MHTTTQGVERYFMCTCIPILYHLNGTELRVINNRYREWWKGAA
jgi:hypothetical protein